MKCIDNKKRVAVGCVLAAVLLAAGCTQKESTAVAEYEEAAYNKDLGRGGLYAENLCVAEGNISIENYTEDTDLHAAALFDLNDKKVLYAYDMQNRLYPASVTKIMTALLALERGNPEDQVTISAHAAASAFPSGAQLCGLNEGEEWSLDALLHALLLYSGNDAATAIAEHIAGSEEAFVALMNQRAGELMAKNTHFKNPHGLHEDDHYTTAYDMYLIFNECIKNESFVDIIQCESYTASYIQTDGNKGEKTFEPTNYYAKGTAEKPDNVTVVGGKTGTTPEAGNCLILLEKDDEGRQYVSVVMGAPDKGTLYADMTHLIQAIP